MPAYAEWATMVNYLGGGDYASYKLKEPGTAHWASSSGEVTNESGFTARPGGARIDYNGAFYYMKTHGFWWTSTSSANGKAFYEMLTDSAPWIEIHDCEWNYGYSVRCVRD